MDITDLNRDIAQGIRLLMGVEGLLIAIGVELVQGTFEADWNALDLNRKKEVVLEGLYRGACVAPRDNSRIICPEMTIDGLIGDGEYNLINLASILSVWDARNITDPLRLKRIIAHDPTSNRRVKEVEHEYRYTDGSPDLLKAFLYHALLLRSGYIVEALRGILEAYLDRPPAPDYLAKMSSQRKDDNKRNRGIARAELKKSGIRVDESQCKEQAAGPVLYACTSCHGTKERDSLKRCGQCQLAWYCSRECQRTDWADHKKFCGQQHFDPELLSPTPEGPAEFIGCPVAVPGFIRTPALWRQIWYLSKPDSQTQDYHFDTTYGHTTSLQISHPPGARFVFLVARRRAMTSGSFPDLYMMLTILECQFSLELTLEQIRRQLETECRVSLPDSGRGSAGAFVPPTAQELAEEKSYLAQRLSKVPMQQK
ncbi:hypothetical protein C8R44DRAFT_928527 [Mycena epipterygia]|nr:hypothetical protein C8R44DRAFT_928527 [Mycena epipterygia]